MITVKKLDSGRHNNFDLLRFVAASLVILSHSYLVTGNFKIEPLSKFIGFIDFGALGVKVFFSVSGFLITKSLFRQASLNSFVWARCLRIFPGLFVSALFCAFIIGPFCTSLTLSNYFGSKAVYQFVLQNVTLHNFTNNLPGTFENNPYPNSVNSPVWTLSAELLMYLCVFLLGSLLLIVKTQFNVLLKALPLLAVVLFFCWGLPHEPWYMYYVYDWSILFLMGSCCYLLRGKIILSVPFFISLLMAFYISFHFRLPFAVYIFDVLLVYGILLFAYHPKLQVKSFNRLGDFSYGLYIFAFPIQQLLVLKLHVLNPLMHFALCYPMALAIAVPSWYFIESPMLKLKNAAYFKEGLIRYSLNIIRPSN